MAIKKTRSQNIIRIIQRTTIVTIAKRKLIKKKITVGKGNTIDNLMKMKIMIVTIVTIMKTAVEIVKKKSKLIKTIYKQMNRKIKMISVIMPLN
jgi:hypothetical protein